MISQKGFTLIELVIVVSIIGILAAIAIPNFSTYRARAAASEGYSLFKSVKKNISQFYDQTGRLPSDNAETGVPHPELIRGKQVKSITVDNGAVWVQFHEKSQATLEIKDLRFYPVVAKNNSTGSISWISGSSQIQPWMKLFHDIPSKE
jgi:type IV pilus assembly protein PilA